MSTNVSRLESLKITPEELIEALNDIDKAEALMKDRGLSREDLLKSADLLSKDIAAAVAAVNMV